MNYLCLQCGLRAELRIATQEGATFCSVGCARKYEAAPFLVDIESVTRTNTDYRKVLYTMPHQQLVVMAITPDDYNIPAEVHPNTTQFIRVEEGRGIAIVDGKRYELRDGVSLTIPPGCHHEVINDDDKTTLKLYSIYSPPEHPPGRRDIRKPK